ncbi:MAG: autotransporter outer membrane beta-barrel domain-containing protein [Akkermansiaceae bacterium]|nr:autotransporter outer membrane beta-barrel domain-containing protein [Akkermansiaceae bacterium]
MKLHLPSALRHALLSYLAAFAAPVLTTASASLSGAALFTLMAAPSAVYAAEHGEDLDVTDEKTIDLTDEDELYTGTISGSGNLQLTGSGTLTIETGGESFSSGTLSFIDTTSTAADHTTFKFLDTDAQLKLNKLQLNGSYMELNIASGATIYTDNISAADTESTLLISGGGRLTLFTSGFTDHAKVNLELKDHSILGLNATTYGAMEGASNIWEAGAGHVFKSLTIADGQTGTLLFNRLRDEGLSTLLPKGAVTFTDYFTLGKGATLNLASVHSDKADSPIVFFKGGADFRPGTLELYGDSSLTLYAEDSTSEDGISIRIGKILTNDAYVEDSEQKIILRSQSDKAYFQIDTDESYVVSHALEVLGGTETHVYKEDHGRLVKTGQGVVTFEGKSSPHYLKIEEGGIIFKADRYRDFTDASWSYADSEMSDEFGAMYSAQNPNGGTGLVSYSKIVVSQTPIEVAQNAVIGFHGPSKIFHDFTIDGDIDLDTWERNGETRTTYLGLMRGSIYRRDYWDPDKNYDSFDYEVTWDSDTSSWVINYDKPLITQTEEDGTLTVLHRKAALHIGGLTTSNIKNDQATGIACLSYADSTELGDDGTANVDYVMMSNEYLDFVINIDGTEVQDENGNEKTIYLTKKAYGVSFLSKQGFRYSGWEAFTRSEALDLTKTGRGTQVLSNFEELGSLTLGGEWNNGEATKYGGTLELRGVGTVQGDVVIHDGVLMVAQYDAYYNVGNESGGTRAADAPGTKITFAKNLDLQVKEGEDVVAVSKLGISGGAEVVLADGRNIIGGLVGGEAEIEYGYEAKLDEDGNVVRDEDGKAILLEKELGTRAAGQALSWNWIGTQDGEDSTLEINVWEKNETVRHNGMLGVANNITLEKTGAGKQEVRGISAETLVVKDGRFRIIGRGDSEARDNWTTHRSIRNITVDGEDSFFEVAVDGANFWWAEETTMTLTNKGNFRSSGDNEQNVTSEFYVNRLNVRGEGNLLWSTDKIWTGEGSANTRGADSHEFIFGQLSSVDEAGAYDAATQHLLNISPMTRTAANGSQVVVFRHILDFNGNITGSMTDNSNFVQLGMNMNDLPLSAANGGVIQLDVASIHAVTLNNYQESDDRKFAADINVKGGVMSEVFRKEGAGKLTISGTNGLTICNRGTTNGGLLFMNYDGEVDITSTATKVYGAVNKNLAISVGEDVTLFYDTGVPSKTLHYLKLFQMEALSRFYVDITALANVDDLIREDGPGVSLGITYETLADTPHPDAEGQMSPEDFLKAVSLDALKENITLRGVDEDKTEWDLLWVYEECEHGANKLGEWVVYLKVTNGALVFESQKFNWDTKWGGAAYFGPTGDEMKMHEFHLGNVTTDQRGDNGARTGHGFTFTQGKPFEENFLSLAHQDFFRESTTGQNRMMVRLVGGGAADGDATTASVIGGHVYLANEDHDDEWKLYGNTYISLVDPADMQDNYTDILTPGDDKRHFHLLVGGSSCLVLGKSAATDEALGGFYGDTHIQVQGGSVDYIVGGNHVNNSPFIFKGNTFISVFKGAVNGGIVGGSTLTKGSMNEYVNAFEGSSHIFVYSLLQNANPGGTGTPAIADGTPSQEGAGLGKGFGAIVGGNAWIDLPQEDITESMAPKFVGNAQIWVDLTDERGDAYKQDGSFEKDIVGGNYTVFSADNDGASGQRSSLFKSDEIDSRITITAFTDKHTFTGSINGASRRARGGAGSTTYTGNVLVSLNGGTYHNIVAGGLWFDETAVGDYTSTITGNTRVEANSGTYWRLVGGSCLLGGGENSSGQSIGSATVVVHDGLITNDDMELSGDIQQDVALVVGGDAYRNNSGNSHVREVGETAVLIDGGTFKSAHVVGGDYANSSTKSSGSGATGIEQKNASRVVIDSSGDNTPGVNLDGLVIGGSYLTDQGTQGSVKVNGTSVTLTGRALSDTEKADAGIDEWFKDHSTYNVHITAETNNGDHPHAGIAVVGGGVLVDDGSAGAHKLDMGATSVTLNSGVYVDGHLVGGSFVNNAEGGSNTITSGNVDISLKGGHLNGNVYGGHYSENESDPDTLTIGNITIRLQGCEMVGDLVGGGYRASGEDATESTATSPSTQGDIHIYLTSGSLTGNVYAAGFSGADSGNSSTKTSSTKITLDKDIVFYAGSPDALNTQGDILISGGYGREKTALNRGTITNHAELEVLATNESLNGWSGGQVHLANFDIVNVAKEASLISGADLFVLRKYEEQAKNSITKNGEGILKVTALSTWNSTDAAVSSGYRGKIIVNDGQLFLTDTNNKQSLTGGLVFGLVHMADHMSAATAYLHSEAGTLGMGTAYSDATDTGLSCKVALTGLTSEIAGKLVAGTYYLATGLDPTLTIDDFVKEGTIYDHLNDSKELGTDGKAIGWLADGLQLELLVTANHELVLSITLKEADQWIWSGLDKEYDPEDPSDSALGDMRWKNDTWANWQTQGNMKLTQEYRTPEGKDVYFLGNGQGEVSVCGTVTPRSMTVTKGAYTLVADATEGGTLSIGTRDYVDPLDENAQPDMGHLIIGGDTQGGVAQLQLKLADSNVPYVELKKDGYLVLSHMNALKTMDMRLGDPPLRAANLNLHFAGGTLAYTSDSAGIADLSDYVTCEDNALVRVRVGDTLMAVQGAAALGNTTDANDASTAITWGRRTTTVSSRNGVSFALGNGVYKTGLGSFTLVWSGGGYGSGAITVAEGTLTCKKHGNETAFLAGDDATVQIGGVKPTLTGHTTDPTHATLKLVVQDATSDYFSGLISGLSLQGNVTGDGLLVVGEADNSTLRDGAKYFLSGTNDKFKGVIDLVGDSSTNDVNLVQFATAASVGGTDTTLRLSGRSFLFDQRTGQDDHKVTLKEIQVTDGTTTYVGSSSFAYANTSISLKGKLSAYSADPLSKDPIQEALHTGTLANGWGNNDQLYFTHTYEGDVFGFRGTILAGAVETKGTATGDTSSSSWTLLNTTSLSKNGQPLELLATLAGAGTIALDQADDVRITGRVGSDVAGNNVTSLQNKSTTKKVIIGDGLVTTTDNGVETKVQAPQWWNETGAKLATATGKNTATGTLSGNIQLGDTVTFGTWSGTSLGENAAFTLTNGWLNAAITDKATTASLNVQTAYLDNATATTHKLSTWVDAGETGGDMLDKIGITAGGKLKNVAGTITVAQGSSSVNLELGAANISLGVSQSALDYMIETTTTGAQKGMVVNKGGSFELTLTNEAFGSALKQIATSLVNNGESRYNRRDFYLNIIHGGDLEIADDFATDGLTNAVLKAGSGANDLMKMLEFQVEGTDAGCIVMSGWLRQIYLVLDEKGQTDPTLLLGDAHTVADYGILSDYKATFVDGGETLTITLAGGAPTLPGDAAANDLRRRDVEAGGLIINNLVGVTGSHMEITNTDATGAGTPDDARLSIILRNASFDPGEIKGAGPYEKEHQDVLGIDTAFEGSISAGWGVDITKRDAGVFTIGWRGQGGLSMKDGVFILEDGGLTLDGESNTLTTIRLAYTDLTNYDLAADPTTPTDAELQAKAKRGLTLAYGTTTLTSIDEAGDWVDATGRHRSGADITMRERATLILDGGVSTWADSCLTGDAAAPSTLHLRNNAQLILTGSELQLADVAAHLVSGGKLDVGSNRLNSLLGLTGNGVLKGSGAALSITGNVSGSFSGTFEGEGNTLTVESGASMKFSHRLESSVGGRGWDFVNKGTTIIDMSLANGTATEQFLLGDITLAAGSSTTLKLNTDNWKPISTLNGGTLTVEEGSSLTIDSAGFIHINYEMHGNRFAVAHVSGERRETDHADVALTGVSFLHYTKKDLYIEDGTLWLELKKRNDNFFDVPGMDKNPKAGGHLFWEATDPDKNPKAGDLINDPDSDFGKMVSGLTHSRQEENYGELFSSLAGGAGAATSVLGPVFLEDMHRQLRTIRNRTAQARDQKYVLMRQRYEDGGKGGLHEYPEIISPNPNNFWVAGEGNYDTLRRDRYAPGYTFNNWGGTLGLDSTLIPDTTVGLALTAMYGKLTVDSSDHSRGHMDTSYITAYATTADGAWNHTLILSAGLADVELNRTVTHSAGSYSTHGETNGYTLGAIYELTYSFMVDEATSCVLQPVLNAEYRYAYLKGYTESGSDAGLHVGDISQSIATFGLGVRMRATAGATACNRNSFFELRALAKADVGERAGRVNNALINGTALRDEVKSARKGAVGAELGAGVTVPISATENLFMDLSVELRPYYHNVDLNAGYRVSF